MKNCISVSSESLSLVGSSSSHMLPHTVLELLDNLRILQRLLEGTVPGLTARCLTRATFTMGTELDVSKVSPAG